MIVITGLGRCGTSFLAQFLLKNGQKLGKVHWDSRVHAGAEDRLTVGINREIYGKIQEGCEIQNIETLVKPYILNVQEITKDPRFTWHPEIIKMWNRCRPVRVIMCHRNFESIASSYERFISLTNAPVDTKFLADIPTLKRRFAEFIDAVSEQGIKMNILRFPDYLGKRDEVFDLLLESGITLYSKAYEIWDELVDKKKVHYK